MSKRNEPIESADGSAPTEKPPESPPGEKPPTEVAARKSPRDWAIELGHGPQKPRHEWNSSGTSRPMGSLAYEVAAVLHGWREHEHHANAPMMLTREEFEGALKAALPENELDEKGNVKKLAGNPEPHKPALSPHRGGTQRVKFGDLPQHKGERSAP